jgi:predicted transglutaminase-like cysteine proteinase
MNPLLPERAPARLTSLRVASLALAFAVAAALTGPADAKAKGKKPREQTISPAELTIAPPAPVQARFFTINQVLAKRDAALNGVRVAAVDPKNDVSDAPNAAAPMRERGPEPFGLFVFRAPEGLLWTKWRKLEAEMREEASTLAACRADPEACSAEAIRFNKLVTVASRQSGRDRLSTISHAVNANIRYTSDYAQHGVADLWSAPLATLGSGRGDCEDYAVLKYAVLRDAGVSPDDMRLVLLRDSQSREDHAVLSVRDDGRWYILDNRRLGFYEDRELPHYLPLFAIDQNGVKLFAAPYAARPLHESEMDVAPAMAGDQASGNISDLPYLL